MFQLHTKRLLIATASVVGDPLVSAEGQELGTVYDLMIDPEDGIVAFAVVSFNSAARPSGELFVIPWRLLQPQPEQHRFVLDVKMAEEQVAAASSSDSIPDEDDWRWVSNGRERFAFKNRRD